MSISIEKVGRRSYLVGDTYALRARIKEAGGHWDAERRAWWVSDVEKALQLAGHASAAHAQDSGDAQASGAQLGDEDRIAGKARYRGKEYILVWEGTTKRGQAAKLAFSNGAKLFWANAGEYEVTKRYDARRDRRSGREEHMTYGRLKRLRERYARARAEGNDDGIANGQRYECPECGEYVTRGAGSCWETGAAH